MLKILNANTGELKTSGIDFAARYSFNLGFGLPFFGETSRLDFGTNYTWLAEFDSTPVAALPAVVNKCAGSFGTTCGQPLVTCYDLGASKLGSGLPSQGIVHLRGWSAALLPGRGGHARPDGGLPPESQAWQHLCAAGGDR